MEAIFLSLEFEKLYDIAFPESEDKAELYFQDNYSNVDGKVIISKGNSLDLGTYFNSFSILKWSLYTTIHKLKISLNCIGKFDVFFYGFNTNGEKEISRHQFINSFEEIFNVENLNDFDFLGIKLTALSDDAVFLGGSYYGLFDTEREVKIGITICTFKREKYLLPNLDKLKILTGRNANINVMVIDNGRTLEEIHSDQLQIIHNPNFGGSGGFTRGFIEQVNQGKNSHVLLMDDDVVIELSSIYRLYSMLRHLKSEFQSNFFSGAMLNIDKPTIQTENTACWNKIIAKTFGGGFNLADKKIICLNEKNPKHINSYAGWWFCCIPVEVIKRIGYPLPIFIKGDDVEYSIRHGKDLLTMNGVCVWHEAFGNKFSPAMRYFNDRNMLLINHLANGCNRFTFLFAVIARLIKHFLKDSSNEIRMLELALKDLTGDMEKIVALPADKKFEQVKNYPMTKNVLYSACSSIFLGIKYFFRYGEHNYKVKNFICEKLYNQDFWRRYLNI